MQIEYLATNLLIAYEFNNVNHPDSQIDRIANSIREFGFTNPLLISRDGVVIAGHGRLLAAKKLGLEEVPVIRLESLTKSQERAYRILDNKLTRDSEWNFENIQIDFDAMEEEGFDFAKWGLESLIPSQTEEDVQAQEDDFQGAELEKVLTNIKLGDLIELGPHRFLCGDSTSAEHVSALMDGNTLDMIVTDPPYGVSYVGKTKEALTLQNDSLDEPSLKKLWSEVCETWLSVTRLGGSVYAAVPARPISQIFSGVLIDLGVLRQQLIWNKDSLVTGRSDYHYKHEPVLYGWRPGGAHYFTDDRTKTSVLDFARPKASKEHPTMKPIALWAEMISNSSKRGEKVGDPFLGSGTTLLACEQLSRNCYGMEIEPRYCQVIIDRFRKYCVDNGKEFNCKINGERFP